MNRSRAAIAVLAAVAAAAIVYSRKDKRDHQSHHSAPDAGVDWVGLPPPPSKPGDRLVIDLASNPATHYGVSGADADDDYRELAVRLASGRARYDSALSRAAAESAYQGAVHGAPPPEAVSMFILHSAGAPDASAARFSLRTNDESEEVVARALDEALDDPPTGEGALFFGVGEAATPSDAHTRHVVVLMTRRAYALDLTARSAPLRSRWVATGELPAGFTHAVAHALYPDGHLEEAELEVDGRRFTMRASTGSTPGQLAIGIDGTGRSGPGKLLQISIEIGRPLPRRFELELPAADPELADREAAEAHALALLATDREAHGARPLESDPELTAIARAHSEDMLSAGFFGHRSPSTGLAGDRVRKAGYRATTFGENLAKNDSLAEAESSLLGSVGHRANLLSDRFTHVGVGVGSAVERGRRQWYVTQLFARPVEVINEADLASDVLARLTAARGGAELTIDGDLEAIARHGAELAASGDTDNLADRLGKRASDATGRTITVSIQVIYQLDQLELPTSLTGEVISIAGIGVAQSDSDPAGRIGVVVISGR